MAYSSVLYHDFNPRLREGGDGVANSWAGAKKFQSTPPRRRRRRSNDGAKSNKISIHASAKEATYSCKSPSG